MAEGDGAAPTVRYRITVRGTVQGVGFRPFVYHLARSCGIAGNVMNAGQGVVVEAEGAGPAVRRFLEAVQANPPRLARIEGLSWEVLSPAGYTKFDIVSSTGGGGIETLLPPDVGLCPDCARETFDPADRHYGYPFTNCTNCGPRFTIVRELPYDRPQTSMATFAMCADCAREYHDPADRRFHAQPVACPVCGPRVALVDAGGRSVAGEWTQVCWELLAQGGILALKSLGGFHLACDAHNREALRELRRRKGREAKPLAVMARDLTTVARYCHLDEKERELLTSPAAPIVVLRRRPSADLPTELSPGLQTLGVMLPYTPLHFLLFGESPFDLLVMTSGNYSELPLIRDNARALDELGGIADYFLWHDREIVNRCDDSVAMVVGGETRLLRRSRGYVPVPVFVPAGDGPVVLGIGGEMKNAFCLLSHGRAFLSQHIGELDSVEGEQHLWAGLRNFQRLQDLKPEIVGYDLHPHYRSSRLAEKVSARMRFAVQHHHAHLASCLADNGLDERVVGVILDGTGYGPDGTLWGFEVLTGDYQDYNREMHLAPVPLPGGEAAVRAPWRTAVSYLLTHLGGEGARVAGWRFGERDRELDVVQQMITRGFNAPLSAGCGRLFDAVAALAGICTVNTYEGQAAIELGEMVLEEAGGLNLPPYSYTIDEGVISPAGIIAGVVDDLTRGLAIAVIATRFHNTVSAIVREAVRQVCAATGLTTVVLSGGTWQNRYLYQQTRTVLAGDGFRVLSHRQVPSNDGGLCLGQAMIAYRRWQQCV